MSGSAAASSSASTAAVFATTWDSDDEETSGPTCRVCFVSEEDEKTLCTPCKCTGTQKHIHLKCLRRWQDNVQQRSVEDERAFRCSVCRAPFSVPPRQQRPAARRALHAMRGLGGAALLGAMAFGLSGPPWPHLVLLLLLLLGSRSHSLLALGLLAAGTLLASLHTSGMRVVMRMDGSGRLGVAVVRFGAPIPGIGPGTLLVASEALDGTLFARSVVLLTEYSVGQGGRGVMLTQPMHAPAAPSSGGEGGEAAWAAMDGSAAEDGGFGEGAGDDGTGSRSRRSWRASSGGSNGGAPQRRPAVIKHFLGGPVGMPGEGVRQEIRIIHTVPGVGGSLPILRPPNGTAASTGAARGSSGGGGAASRPANHTRLWLGGSLKEVLERAVQGPRGDEGHSGTVVVFHGICSWGEAQLEGEIRAGNWGYAPGRAEDLLQRPTPAEGLWQGLVAGQRLTLVA